jgi:hypothetical protein
MLAEYETPDPSGVIFLVCVTSAIYGVLIYCECRERGRLERKRRREMMGDLESINT